MKLCAKSLAIILTSNGLLVFGLVGLVGLSVSIVVGQIPINWPSSFFVLKLKYREYTFSCLAWGDREMGWITMFDNKCFVRRYLERERKGRNFWILCACVEKSIPALTPLKSMARLRCNDLHLLANFALPVVRQDWLGLIQIRNKHAGRCPAYANRSAIPLQKGTWRCGASCVRAPYLLSLSFSSFNSKYFRMNAYSNSLGKEFNHV